MEMKLEPNRNNCGTSVPATSFSVGPGDHQEMTIVAGYTFSTTATWTDPSNPAQLVEETQDFFCDGDDTGTPVTHRDTDCDFYVFFGGTGGGLTP